MMLALLKKDWRLNRAVVVSALIMSALPYVLTVANIWVNPPANRALEPRDYFESVQTAAYACVMLSVVLAAAFGGVTFAAERRERTAEFLAVLPAPRSAIIVSKLLVPAACIVVLVAVHFTVLVAFVRWGALYGANRPNDWADFVRAICLAFGFAVALFGVAWALSVYLRSPAISASISIVVGFGLLFGGTVWLERAVSTWDAISGSNFAQASIPFILAGLTTAVGLAAILATSVLYVRRVEP